MAYTNSSSNLADISSRLSPKLSHKLQVADNVLSILGVREPSRDIEAEAVLLMMKFSMRDA